MKNKDNVKTFLIIAIMFFIPLLVLFPQLINGSNDTIIIFITFAIADLFLWGMFVRHIIRSTKRKKIIQEGKEYIATYISYKFAMSLNNIPYYYITYFWKNEYGATQEGESLGYYSAEEVEIYRDAQKFKIKVMGSESAIISKSSELMEKSKVCINENNSEVVCEYCLSFFSKLSDQCPYCGANRKKD